MPKGVMLMANRETAHERADRRHDKVVEDSFPASDLPANSGIIGPEGRHAGADPRGPSHQRGDEARPKGTPTDERHATETAMSGRMKRRPRGESDDVCL